MVNRRNRPSKQNLGKTVVSVKEERVEGVWCVGGGGGGQNVMVLQGFPNPTTPEVLLPYIFPTYGIGPPIIVSASSYLHRRYLYIWVGLCN